MLISSSLSLAYQVQELDVKLPKYSMYALLPQGQHVLPASCVTFSIKDRAARCRNVVLAALEVAHGCMRTGWQAGFRAISS